MSEPGEQRVSRGVSEGVVVALEAVEVVEREHGVGGVLPGGRLQFKRVGERAAVGQPRQRISQRLRADAREQA